LTHILTEEIENSEEESGSPAEVNLLLSFFGGSGIGLLFGIVMGGSVTPTVAMVMGGY